MQKKSNMLAVAVAALIALSCATMFLSEESTAATASDTKDGVTVVYTEYDSGAILHFSFASESPIKGDNVYTVINNKDYGPLDLLSISNFDLGEKCSVVSISLTQNSHNVLMTLYPGSGYAVIINQASNGSISSDVSSAEAGAKVTLTATPNTGYALVKWIITPNVTITNNTFTMPASNVTVTAEFSQATSYTVNVEAEGSGSITSSQSRAVVGAIITLTVSPSSDEYEFKEWKNVTPSGLTISKVNNTTYQFTMPSDNVSLKAVFQAASPHQYTINVSPAEGGTVTKATGSATLGTIVPIDLELLPGYTVKDFNTDPTVEVTTVGDSYCFVMPASDITVTANLKAAQSYSVSVSAGSGGNISTSATSAMEGTTVIVTLTFSTGFVFDKWTTKTPSSLELTKISGSDSYSFVMPAGAVTLKASFKEQTEVTKEVKNGSISFGIDSEITADSTVSLVIDCPECAKQINVPKSAKAYTVTASVKTDGKTVDISDKKNITLSLAYTIPSGQSVSDLKVYYVSDDGTVVERQISEYEDGFLVVESAYGSKLSSSTYVVTTEYLTYLPSGTIGIRDGMNGSVSVKTGGDVKQSTTLDLSVNKVSPSLKNIPSDAKTYDVSLTAKNGNVTVDLSQNVVTLSLDASSMDISKRIYAYYVSDDGKTVEKMNASLTEENEIKFVITHCSLYVLSYEEIQPVQGDSTMLIIIAIVVVIVVLLIAVLLLSRRKPRDDNSQL